MAKYRVTAIKDGNAFARFGKDLLECNYVGTEYKIIDHERVAVEHYDIVTTMSMDRRLDLSDDVVRYLECCEICGVCETDSDGPWLETDTGSVCSSQCQADAKGANES